MGCAALHPSYMALRHPLTHFSFPPCFSFSPYTSHSRQNPLLHLPIIRLTLYIYLRSCHGITGREDLSAAWHFPRQCRLLQWLRRRAHGSSLSSFLCPRPAAL